MHSYELRRIQWIGRPLAEVFAFFADAHNLEAITPPWLRFEIVTPRPIDMRPGATIDYIIRWHGWPLRWRTEIVHWQPNEMFIDEQAAGPYRLWRHSHRFEANAGGTRMTDEVWYALPFGPLGRLTHRLFVRRDLERVFDHRADRIAALLSPASGT